MRRALLPTRAIVAVPLWYGCRLFSHDGESRASAPESASSTSGTTATTTSAAAAAAAKAGATAAQTNTTGGATAKPTNAPAAGAAEVKEEYSIPTADILRAVKQRDFNAFQSHAVGIVHHKWKEEHNIPAVCLLILLVTWYSVSSARRRVVRSCKATEAKVKEEAEQTVELVGTLVRKWRQDIQRADQHLQLILDKNSELTKDIDRMTAALRQCYVNVPASKGAQAKESAQE
ncbi:hypothetical protein DQ04_00661190 [Trypanosoma grayi]|uniref:hypothetical protein n=1 Tax=Trypanosoma grayi TaxID=71804 RepID=UPI0004F498D5|nr:hypothetical protein DQ04_00661190 [Trypanosoma grayi]KEG14041.1 hypothetical protein DQ04_00661190 [Trypanosoma grayi]